MMGGSCMYQKKVREGNFEKVLQEFGGPNAVQEWILLIFPKASTMV